MFDKFNTDGDNYISTKEFSKGHTMLFNKMDKNHDGFVTTDEAKDSGKCGDGKCGGADKVKKEKKEMKCGAGKCGGGTQ